MLKKNRIYLKYNFCNNIHNHSKAWGQYLFIFFWKKYIFIQQGFVKLVETVIVNIDIVRKLLNKWTPKKYQSQVPKKIKKINKNKQHYFFQDW